METCRAGNRALISNAADRAVEFDRAILHREANVLALGGGDNRGGSGPVADRGMEMT